MTFTAVSPLCLALLLCDVSLLQGRDAAISTRWRPCARSVWESKRRVPEFVRRLLLSPPFRRLFAGRGERPLTGVAEPGNPSRAMPLENRGLSLRSFRRLQPRNVARLRVAAVGGGEVVHGQQVDPPHDREGRVRVGVGHEATNGSVGDAVAVDDEIGGEKSAVGRVPELEVPASGDDEAPDMSAASERCAHSEVNHPRHKAPFFGKPIPVSRESTRWRVPDRMAARHRKQARRKAASNPLFRHY